MKKLTEADRLDITKRLAVMDRQMLIGVREVAVLYNTTIASVQQACCTKRIDRGDVALRLPPQVKGIGRRVAWFFGDVRDLLAQAQMPAPAAKPSTEANPDPSAPIPAGGQPQGASPPKGKEKETKRMGRQRKA